jgi:hypothetical protein
MLADGALSLDTARCVGACGIAPVVIFDGQVSGHQTTETHAIGAMPLHVQLIGADGGVRDEVWRH